MGGDPNMVVFRGDEHTPHSSGCSFPYFYWMRLSGQGKYIICEVALFNNRLHRGCIFYQLSVAYRQRCHCKLYFGFIQLRESSSKAWILDISMTITDKHPQHYLINVLVSFHKHSLSHQGKLCRALTEAVSHCSRWVLPQLPSWWNPDILHIQTLWAWSKDEKEPFSLYQLSQTPFSLWSSILPSAQPRPTPSPFPRLGWNRRNRQLDPPQGNARWWCCQSK